MNEYLSVYDIANILKLSELTVRRYLKLKKLTGFKVGRFWRIQKTELDRFINSNSGGSDDGGEIKWKIL